MGGLIFAGMAEGLGNAGVGIGRQMYQDAAQSEHIKEAADAQVDLDKRKREALREHMATMAAKVEALYNEKIKAAQADGPQQLDPRTAAMDKMGIARSIGAEDIAEGYRKDYATMSAREEAQAKIEEAGARRRMYDAATEKTNSVRQQNADTARLRALSQGGGSRSGSNGGGYSGDLGKHIDAATKPFMSAFEASKDGVTGADEAGKAVYMRLVRDGIASGKDATHVASAALMKILEIRKEAGGINDAYTAKINALIAPPKKTKFENYDPFEGADTELVKAAQREGESGGQARTSMGDTEPRLIFRGEKNGRLEFINPATGEIVYKDQNSGGRLKNAMGLVRSVLK